MMDIKEFVKQILKKKKWKQSKFVEEINKVKKQLNIEGETRKQNINNILNNKEYNVGFKTALLWEIALKLPENSLTNMVSLPRDYKAKKEFEELKQKARKIRK